MSRADVPARVVPGGAGMKRRLSARRAPTRPTPLCGHDDELIEAAALDLLEPADRGLLAERLGECPECRARFADALSLAGALRQLIPAEAGDVAHAPAESAFVAAFRAPRAADEQRHGGGGAGPPPRVRPPPPRAPPPPPARGGGPRKGADRAG